ncbi:MAG: hypothetical protein AAFP20_19265 [Cyanobacteria bacterium J06614_10]
MSWDLIGDVPVSFEGEQLSVPLIGDVLIKVEHTFDFESFPGIGFAWISDIYANDERRLFIKSYPHKNSSRVYPLEVPEVMVEAGWLVRHLVVKRSVRARVDTDANWRIRIYEWIGSTPPESTIDGNGATGDGEQQIFDGNP